MKNRLVNSNTTLLKTIANHAIFYPTPANLSYAWSFGSLVGLYFAIQILTGIMLAMHYVSDASLAFDSVIHIMRDVKNGWLIRYMHSNGASMIFILMYIHIGRGLYYQSYFHRRKALWWTGLIIFILMMATAFIGYVLPWGQMSFWGATVITSLVTAIPLVGDNIATWLWGGFSVGDATLTRFYSLHYLLPFIITSLIFAHLTVLHHEGSTNPSQTACDDYILFHPYFTYKDTFAFTVSLIFYVWLVFFWPNWLGHPDNWIPANPLSTPSHIVPEWYFTPFYAILRAFPTKLGGVVGMAGSLLILFVLPLYRYFNTELPSTISPFFKFFFWQFVAVFFILMFLGGKPAVAPYVVCSQIFTFFYFFYFIVIITIRHSIENYIFQKQNFKI